jgi:hypothetical protein
VGGDKNFGAKRQNFGVNGKFFSAALRNNAAICNAIHHKNPPLHPNFYPSVRSAVHQIQKKNKLTQQKKQNA